MGSLVLIKPDAFERALTVDIMFRLHEIGTIARTKYIDRITREQLDLHYAEHVDKPSYLGLVEAMEGKEALAVHVYGDVYGIREKCLKIRSLYLDAGYVGPRNIIHSSDSEHAAERELALWFPHPVERILAASPRGSDFNLPV